MKDKDIDNPMARPDYIEETQDRWGHGFPATDEPPRGGDYPDDCPIGFSGDEEE